MEWLESGWECQSRILNQYWDQDIYSILCVEKNNIPHTLLQNRYILNGGGVCPCVFLVWSSSTQRLLTTEGAIALCAWGAGLRPCLVGEHTKFLRQSHWKAGRCWYKKIACWRDVAMKMWGSNEAVGTPEGPQEKTLFSCWE